MYNSDARCKIDQKWVWLLIPLLCGRVRSWMTKGHMYVVCAIAYSSICGHTGSSSYGTNAYGILSNNQRKENVRLPIRTYTSSHPLPGTITISILTGKWTTCCPNLWQVNYKVWHFDEWVGRSWTATNAWDICVQCRGLNRFCAGGGGGWLDSRETGADGGRKAFGNNTCSERIYRDTSNTERV